MKGMLVCLLVALATSWGHAESRKAEHRLEGDDVAPREERKGSAGTFKTCGCTYPEWQLHKTKKGWAKAWTQRGRPTGGSPVACNKFPTKKVPPEIEKMVKADYKMGPGWTMGLDQQGQKTEGDETWKWLSVGVCSKNYELPISNCNEADSKVVCEYTGSRTALYINRIAHYERRAQIRKKDGKTETCMNLLEAAKDDYDVFERDVAPPGNVKWTKGLKYKLMDPKTKLAEGPILPEEQALKMIREKGKLASERFASDWCKK